MITTAIPTMAITTSREGITAAVMILLLLLDDEEELVVSLEVGGRLHWKHLLSGGLMITEAIDLLILTRAFSSTIRVDTISISLQLK